MSARPFATSAGGSCIRNGKYDIKKSSVRPEGKREKIDIVKLNARIKEIVVREQVLRDEIAKIIAEIEV